jgi:hypothetical protein
LAAAGAHGRELVGEGAIEVAELGDTIGLPGDELEFVLPFFARHGVAPERLALSGSAKPPLD